MKGTKADALDRWAGEHGRSCIRFDYRGTANPAATSSTARSAAGLRKASRCSRGFAKGPQVLIGSSMGGWLALLLVQALKARKTAGSVAGLVLIAPAVDFTEELMWKNFSPEMKRQIETEGSWQRPSQYSESAVSDHPRADRGRPQASAARRLIETGCPVRILQGVQDPDVPWQHAVELSSRLARDDVVLTLVKDGDHRLSRPEDIERLIAAVAEF